MWLKPETTRLFEKLQELYNEREELAKGRYWAIKLNAEKIQLIESLVQSHCNQEYNTPWFRVYTFWVVHHKAEFNIL